VYLSPLDDYLYKERFSVGCLVHGGMRSRKRLKIYILSDALRNHMHPLKMSVNICFKKCFLDWAWWLHAQLLAEIWRLAG
jgi:hypothetical protein